MPLALITGGAKRIGAAIALVLGEAGFDIALHVNSSQKEGEALLKKLLKFGVKAEIYSLDLSQLGKIESMFSDITKSLGRVDIVVNNASMFAFDSPSEFDFELAQKLNAVNLLAPAELTRCLAKYGTKDALAINMLDNKVFALNPDFFSYTLTKVGLKGAGDMMAMAYAGKVRVNAIAPGVTMISGDQSQQNFEKSWRMSLSGVGATPQEIAATVLYMWKTKSINGETIVLDGGQRHMALQRDVAFVVGEDDG